MKNNFANENHGDNDDLWTSVETDLEIWNSQRDDRIFGQEKRNEKTVWRN